MGASVSTNQLQDHGPSPLKTPTTTTSTTAKTAQAQSGEVIKKDNSSGHADTCKVLEKISSKTEPMAPIEKKPPVIAVSSDISSSSSSSSNNSNNNSNSNSRTTSNSKTMVEEKKMKPNNNSNNKQLPYRYADIIRDADEIINPAELHDRLRSGVFLNKKNKKYWVESSGHNCFMLFPKSLSITWGEDKRFWQWPSIKLESSERDHDEVMVEVAELLNVCWLEVHGKLDISYLSPGVNYEVVFVVKLKDYSYGWDVPVNLRLVLPDGTTQHQHKVNLQMKPRSQWVELHVGEFQAPPNNKQENKAAEIEVSMFEYEGGQWKRGLVIKGVIIRPKK